MWTRTPNTWIYRPFCAGRPTEAPIQRTAPPPDVSGRGQRSPRLALLSGLESTASPLSGL